MSNDVIHTRTPLTDNGKFLDDIIDAPQKVLLYFTYIIAPFLTWATQRESGRKSGPNFGLFRHCKNMGAVDEVSKAILDFKLVVLVYK